MGSINKILKRFDLNPATDESFQVRTITGAISISAWVDFPSSLCNYCIINGASVLGRTQDVHDLCCFCFVD